MSTVSYALSGNRPISEGTRQRIFAAMDELGYQPHALARGLASRRSRILALLFPVTERGLGVTELEFVVGAADEALARGYHLILWPSADTGADSSAEEVQSLVRQSLVDGVVLMEVHKEDRRILALRELRFPFSIIGRCADNTGLDSVDTDFESTMDEVVRYLHGLGHGAIGYITQSQQTYERGYGPTLRSVDSFKQAATKYGVRGTVQFSGASAYEGGEAVRTLLAAQPDVTALVAMNDRALAGVIEALAEMELDVPEDVSVLTVMSSPRVGEIFRPPVTTFAAPSDEMARMGVDLLIDQLESSAHSNRQVLISCPLMERGSTARRRV